MMKREDQLKREQVQFVCMDDLVPKDHLLRHVESALAFGFIYDTILWKIHTHIQADRV